MQVRVLVLVELLLTRLRVVCVLRRDRGRRVGMNQLLRMRLRLRVPTRRLEVVLGHGPVVRGVSHMLRYCVDGLDLVRFGRSI
jgi:hypothetical protein